MAHESLARFFAMGGRALVLLGILALVGAWITEIIDRPLLGMSQEHLFFDAIALTVLGIAFMADSMLHARQA
jgi:hypothetical protein